MQMKIGERMVDVDMTKGVPVIHATSKEIKHKDGRVDVQIFIPSMKIVNRSHGLKAFLGCIASFAKTICML